MRSSCIFHTIGISAAADKFAEVWHDKADKYANDRQSAERIIKAYLDASGMVLIPIENANLALNSLRYAQVIMGEGGSHDRVAAIKALETMVSKS